MSKIPWLEQAAYDGLSDRAHGTKWFPVLRDHRPAEYGCSCGEQAPGGTPDWVECPVLESIAHHFYGKDE